MAELLNTTINGTLNVNKYNENNEIINFFNIDDNGNLTLNDNKSNIILSANSSNTIINNQLKVSSINTPYLEIGDKTKYDGKLDVYGIVNINDSLKIDSSVISLLSDNNDDKEVLSLDKNGNITIKSYNTTSKKYSDLNINSTGLVSTGSIQALSLNTNNLKISSNTISSPFDKDITINLDNNKNSFLVTSLTSDSNYNLMRLNQNYFTIDTNNSTFISSPYIQFNVSKKFKKITSIYGRK